jgi:hypothetical protein
VKLFTPMEALHWWGFFVSNLKEGRPRRMAGPLVLSCSENGFATVSMQAHDV